MPNYWIFQGNPAIYDITAALKAGHLKSWKVAAHKDKIKIGDQIIIWQTGNNAGCYALAEVTSEVSIFEEEKYEQQYYKNTESSEPTERVQIKITKNLVEEPVLWTTIKDNPVFYEFKVGNQGTNFSATEKEYETILDFSNTKSLDTTYVKEDTLKYDAKQYKEMHPTNQILYGPPGTGKTYFLKEQLFDKYTSKETSISKEQHFETVVTNCSWWQVIAVALLDIKKGKVSDIFTHKWVQKKASLSNSKTVRPTLWGQLQSHTIEECEYVNVSSRQQPLLFNKTKDSSWEILEEQVKQLTPELYELRDNVVNYNPNPLKGHQTLRFCNLSSIVCLRRFY